MNEQQSKPIVVGVDGSDSARAALELGARHAALAGVPLSVVATWAWPTNYGYAMAFSGDFDPEEEANKLLEEMIEPVQKAYPDLEISGHAVHGEAREVLVDRSRHASMLVLGSRGHGALSGMLLGSVSGYCVSHSHCPTLVVRH